MAYTTEFDKPFRCPLCGAEHADYTAVLGDLPEFTQQDLEEAKKQYLEAFDEYSKVIDTVIQVKFESANKS